MWLYKDRNSIAVTEAATDVIILFDIKVLSAKSQVVF